MSRPVTFPLHAAAHADADRPPAKRDLAFEVARTHSRRVRFLRLALPGAVIGVLLILVLGTWLDPLRLYRKLPIEFAKISISGTRITMEAPKLTGFTRDQRPYTVTAHSAAQDLTKPDIVELTDVIGHVEQPSRGMTELQAKNGVYDIKAEQIHLSGGVEIRASGGYQAKMRNAFVEVRKGRVVSNDPVDIVFPEGTLQASRVEIFEHGAKAVFDGGVTMTVKLPPPSKPETTEGKK